MTTRAIAEIIAKLLGDVFTGIQASNLYTYVWEGIVSLTDLSFNKQSLNPFLGDFRIVSSQLDNVRNEMGVVSIFYLGDYHPPPDS